MDDKKTILAVDDNPGSLALLDRILADAGYEVLTAESGDASLAIASAKRPDLILLDIRMEGMDGLEACRRFRARSDMNDTPIILISAFDDASTWTEGLRLGANDYIGKPFQNEQLLSRVKTQLSYRGVTDSLEERTLALKQANDLLQSGIAERDKTEIALRFSLDRAERSRRAMLSVLEDQKEMEKELRESEARFASAFQDSPVSMTIASSGTSLYVEANDAFLRESGFARNEVIGHSPAELGIFPDHDRLERSTGTEIRLRRKNGEFLDCLAYSRTITLRGDPHFLSTIIDITDRKRAERTRSELESQLQGAQKMEAIGSLAGGVAHDFNNLLSVILNYTSFVIDAAAKDDPALKDLMEVMKAGERAAVLTRQLLAFGRKQMLQPAVLDLNKIVIGVEKMLTRILGEDIDFVRHLAPGLGHVLVDPGQIELVLMNLIVNARDAMPEGGKLAIETSNVEADRDPSGALSAVEPGPYVMLSVTDTGQGIDKETMSRIFEPFFTTKERGKGTGLGLSTVYGIIKQSGGNILVDSEPGRGAAFKIYLPRVFDAVKRDPSGVPEDVGRIRGTGTILIAEDETALREVAVRILESAGYATLSAQDGVEALSLAERFEGEIRLLLTDVVMPRMGGKTLALELLKQRPELPVIYMSGYTADAILHHGVLEGGMYFLGKPFTSVELLKKVGDVLASGLAEGEAGNDRSTARPENGADRPLVEGALRAIPPESVNNLRKALIAANSGEIAALVDEIRESDPGLATELHKMASAYDYSGMRAFLD